MSVGGGCVLSTLAAGAGRLVRAARTAMPGLAGLVLLGAGLAAYDWRASLLATGAVLLYADWRAAR